VSIYSKDEEARSIWRKIIGVPEKRILMFGNLEKGDEENFWSMGPTRMRFSMSPRRISTRRQP